MAECPTTLVTEDTQLQIVTEDRCADLLVEADQELVLESDIAVALGGGTAGKRHDHALGAQRPVPTSGRLWLNAAGVPTSAAPLVAAAAMTVDTLVARVDTADGSRDYAVQVLVNGTVVETLALASGASVATATGLTAAVTPGDEIEVRLARTSGTGRSTFRSALVVLTLTET